MFQLICNPLLEIQFEVALEESQEATVVEMSKMRMMFERINIKLSVIFSF